MEPLLVICLVSIHAPARGATHEVGDVEPAEVVSIHAPTRGATDDAVSGDDVAVVSIHTPTRGATYPIKWGKSSFLFQFTHPRGVRRAGDHPPI